VDVIDNNLAQRDHFEYVKPAPLPATSWLPRGGALCLAEGGLAQTHKAGKQARARTPRPEPNPNNP